jgi:hypothetical protein
MRPDIRWTQSPIADAYVSFVFEQIALETSAGAVEIASQCPSCGMNLTIFQFEVPQGLPAQAGHANMRGF